MKLELAANNLYPLPHKGLAVTPLLLFHCETETPPVQFGKWAGA
jgi:hypothetical protein